VAENLTFNLDVDSSKAVSAINTFFESFDRGAQQAKSKLNSAFNQTIQTDIKVEFKNGKLVAKEVQSLKQESSRLASAYKAVNGELGRTPNALKRQRTVLKSLLGDTEKFKAGTRQVTSEWKVLSEKLRKVQSSLKTMGDSGSSGLAALTGRFIGIQTAANLATAGIMNVVKSVGELVQTAFKMETLSLQMEAFVGSAAGAEEAFDKFLNIAANSPLNLEQVAGAGKIMMAFGMSTDEAVKATEQLALVSAATGGDINLLARNMGQIVAQGRAYTRDLTQFAIQGIPIWEQLSVATGKNVSELKEMAKNGQITGAEVGAALDLMTQKGTAFFEVGQRMQETFAGRFAAIEAATQNLAKEFIESFNLVDKSLGGVVSGSMKLFAGALNTIAANMDALIITLAALTVGIAAYAGVMVALNLGAIVGAIKAIVIAVQGWAAAQTILNVASAFFAGLTGNWLGIAAGVAAAGLAVGVVATNMNKAKEETLGLQGEIANTGEATGKLTEKAIEYAKEIGNKEAVEAYSEQQKLAEGLNQELARSIEILKEQQEARNEDYDKEQERIKGLIDLEKQKVEAAKQAAQEAKDAVDRKYEAEKAHLDETLSMIRQKYDEEIGLLRAKTPAEKELYALEKQKLQTKLESGGLDKEETLRLKARLERMKANEQIQKLMVQQKKEEQTVEKSLAELMEERKVKLGEIEEKQNSVTSQAESNADRLQSDLKESEQAQDDFNQAIKETIKSAEGLGNEVDTTTRAVQSQQGEVRSLAAEYRAAATEARNMASAIRAQNAARAEAAANRPPVTVPTSNFRFAGGPVSGGSAYTVNELGKEAFLSASGALSMINSPAWGTWKAPSSGTVIPAHLTSQLNIPNGGVNINKTSGASPAGVSGGMNMGKLLSAITSVMGGDTVTNNVTIQSANTTQAASDIMVQLAKIKRLRYN